MIEEEAIVIKASKENVTLEVVRSKPCGLCGQVRGCGNSIWGKIFSHRSGHIETRNNLNACAYLLKSLKFLKIIFFFLKKITYLNMS